MLFSIIITGIVVCGLSPDPIIIFVLISWFGSLRQGIYIHALWSIFHPVALLQILLLVSLYPQNLILRADQKMSVSHTGCFHKSQVKTLLEEKGGDHDTTEEMPRQKNSVAYKIIVNVC